MKHSCRGVRVYEQINALPPAGIGKKSATYRGGIGGLSAAAFLVDDHTCPAGSPLIEALRRFCIQ